MTRQHRDERRQAFPWRRRRVVPRSGRRLPARTGSASICTTLAWSGSGRYFVYGKFVPTMNRVSQPSIASSEGAVPSRPMPPVVSGMIVRNDGLSGERLHDRAAEQVGNFEDFFTGMASPCPDEHHDLGAGVERLGRLTEIASRRGSPEAAGRLPPSA